MPQSAHKIAPGQLIHTVRLERYTESVVHGEIVRTWGLIAKRKAAIHTPGAREFWLAEAQANDATHKLRMRYYAGLTTRDRIKFGDRVFNIAAPPVIVDQRDWAMEVICKEVT